MIQTRPKPPATRRAFADGWSELDYLCVKIRYWLYTRKQTAGAYRYLERLQHILRQMAPNDLSILRHECYALMHELKGEIGDAIAHRKKEIALMERLHEEARLPNCTPKTRAYMLRDRDETALQERRAILEALLKQQHTQSNHRNGR